MLIEGLAKRGYNAARMLDTGWDDEGYYLIVLDRQGKALRDETGYVHRVWQYWDAPADYEFVRDWFEGKITDD